MTDEELDGCLVLYFLCWKGKNPCPQKHLKNLSKGNIQKESSAQTLQQFSTWTANRRYGVLFQVSFSIDIFNKISKLYKLISNWYK